jgi:hypothetical protein
VGFGSCVYLVEARKAVVSDVRERGRSQRINSRTYYPETTPEQGRCTADVSGSGKDRSAEKGRGRSWFCVDS